MEKPLQVFCCYAREDQPSLLMLKSHLRPIQREGLINVQDDIDVSPGEEWEPKISRYLNTAQMILLLISSDFMDSDYCYSKEMMRAMERHERGEARVIPIILRPTLWKGAPFRKLQVLPTNAEPVASKFWHTPDDAFLDVAKGIQKAVNELITQSLPGDDGQRVNSFEHRLETYLAVDIPEDCNYWFRPDNRFEFHPDEQFIPLSASWDDGSIARDVAADILGRLQAHKRSRLAISANYGQGKTFLVWKLMLELAKQSERTHLPFFYPLRNYSPNATDSFFGLLSQHYSKLDLKTIFREQDCLLILDAVDEIPISIANSKIAAQTLKTILDTLEGFNRLAIVVTFRSGLFPGGAQEYRTFFPAYDVALLEAWGDQHWADLLRRCEETRYVAFLGGWEQFYKAVEQRPLRDLTSRPLWCKMIIETRDAILASEIYGETDLYEFYIRTYFENVQKKAGAFLMLSAADKIRVMGLLAIQIANRVQASSMRVYITDADLSAAAAQEFKAIPNTQIMAFLLHEMRSYSLLNTATFTPPDAAKPVTYYTLGHHSFQTFFQAHAFVELLNKGMKTIQQRKEDLAALSEQVEVNESMMNFVIGLLKRDYTAVHCFPEILRQDPDDSESFGETSTAVNQIRRTLLWVWIAYSRTIAPSYKVDLSGFYLNSLVLTGMDLSRCRLSDAKLNRAELVNCNLTDSNFADAKCRNTNFTGAKITGATFQGTDLRGALGLVLQ
jgi:TIR domain/Pentapeptide repeats (8 copies)/NACHT domain